MFVFIYSIFYNLFQSKINSWKIDFWDQLLSIHNLFDAIFFIKFLEFIQN